MNRIITVLVVLVFLVGCGDSDSADDSNVTVIDSSEVEEARILAEKEKEDARIKEEARILAEEEAKQKFSPKYYGKWLRVDTKKEINILSSTMIENYDIQSDNLIKVYKDDSSYYLMRAGLSDIVVNGTLQSIENDTTIKKSPSRIGGINVILVNVLDKNISSDVTTEDDGSFETSSLPSGTYNLRVDEEEVSTITISEPIEEIGVYKLTGDNLHNFKAELILEDKFLYADEHTHTAKIRVHNISNQVGYGLHYKFNLEDSDLKSFTNDLVKGSIKAKNYIDIPIHISFNQISQNSKNINIDVEIIDVQNNRWADSFSFTLHKGYFSVNIATEENRVKGYIIMPNTHKVKNIDIGSYGTIKLPLVSDEEYHLLLSNSSFENETAYSLGINKAPQSFETFDETSAHEPNNQENTASNIVLKESIVSYLHATDLDYWKISLPESEYLFDFSLGKFNTAESLVSELITSNNITVSDKILGDKNITIEIDKGTLVINNIDLNVTQTSVKSGDTIAIKLQTPMLNSNSISSTLIIGQNTVIFTINKTDTTAPIFTSSANFRVDENTFLVGKVKAEDKSTLVYSIVDQNLSDFKIDIHSGELKFKERANYEKKNSYELSVKVTDKSNNSSIQNILVDVDDVIVEISRSSDGIVADDDTRLMWQDDFSKQVIQSTAVDYCKNLTLGDYTDWYLPSLERLKTIVDYDRTDPAILAIFQTVFSSKYWTSSLVGASWNSSYSYFNSINFSNGNEDSILGDSSLYVRCVREINE